MTTPSPSKACLRHLLTRKTSQTPAITTWPKAIITQLLLHKYTTQGYKSILSLI